MMRLAEGDRAGAVKQFEACVDTHTIGSIDNEFGRAYQARMKAEPNWPQLLQDLASNRGAVRSKK
jgi:hypothetical protein